MPHPISSKNLRNCDDAELMTLVRSGDLEAIAELFVRHEKSVRRVAFSIVRNWEDAEDVAQEVSVRVLTKIGSFRGSSTFSTWLRRIAINTSLMHLRKRRSHPLCSFDELTEGDACSFSFMADSRPDPEEQFARLEARRKVWRAVSQLPPELRVFVIGQLRDELPLRDVAKKYGVSEAAAKSRVHRARKVLAQRRSHSAAIG